MQYTANQGDTLQWIASTFTFDPSYAVAIASINGMVDTSSATFTSGDATDPESAAGVVIVPLVQGTTLQIPNNYLNAAGYTYAKQSGQDTTGVAAASTVPGATNAGSLLAAGGAGQPNPVIYIALALAAWAIFKN